MFCNFRRGGGCWLVDGRSVGGLSAAQRCGVGRGSLKNGSLGTEEATSPLRKERTAREKGPE